MSNESKIVKFDEDVHEQLLIGVNILADAVRSTMGPRGRNVIIEDGNNVPIMTKDGVTVAKSINLRHKFQNLGVQMIKEAASRTADVAGDGTTTSTVISQSIFAEGVKILAAGYSAPEVKAGIDYATKLVISELRRISTPVTSSKEIEQVGTISANGETEIGELIAKALQEVGNDGTVTVEHAKGFNTTLDIVNGLRINRGFISPYFTTNNDKMITEFDNPYVLLVDKKLESLKEITGILEQILKSQSSLLVIANDVEGEAMQGLVLNKTRANLKVCAIRSPGFGGNRAAQLEDLAVLLGTTVIKEVDGEQLSKIRIEELGRCKKTFTSKTDTVFIDCAGNSERIDERAAALREDISNRTMSDDELAATKRRLATLAGGVAVINVGGATETELRERKDRVDDALAATQAAAEEGIVAGGGVALARSMHVLDGIEDKKSMPGFLVGVNIVKNACVAPLKQIVMNTGVTPEVVLNEVMRLSGAEGYNAALGEYGNMFEMGVIDPVKVVRSALENGASSAAMMLTASCAIVDDISEESESR
jgi:chaperonin GroEL